MLPPLARNSTSAARIAPLLRISPSCAGRRTEHLAVAERAVAQHHLAAGRHRGGAVARGQRAVVANLARDQNDIALRRADLAEIDNRSVAVAAEGQRSSGAELRILDVQRRGHEAAAGVDHAARPDDHSRRIDEVDRAGRRQDAVDRRRHVAGHAVECRAAAVIELNLITLPDRKARPVDDAGAARLADREAGRRSRTDRNVSARHRSAGRQGLRKCRLRITETAQKRDQADGGPKIPGG